MVDASPMVDALLEVENVVLGSKHLAIERGSHIVVGRNTDMVVVCTHSTVDEMDTSERS